MVRWQARANEGLKARIANLQAAQKQQEATISQLQEEKAAAAAKSAKKMASLEAEVAREKRRSDAALLETNKLIADIQAQQHAMKQATEAHVALQRRFKAAEADAKQTQTLQQRVTQLETVLHLPGSLIILFLFVRLIIFHGIPAPGFDHAGKRLQTEDLRF